MNNTTATSISLVSGKGGVGKSNMALNLGYALSQEGKKVLLIDCDMGLANMDVLLGITPEKYMQDILLSGANPKDILIPVVESAGALHIIPANSGIASFAEIDRAGLQIIGNSLNTLAAEYDYFLLDIGAGISPTALGYAAMTAMRILVVTPEPTSLTDGYAFIKVMTNQYSIDYFSILVNQTHSMGEAKQTFDRLNMVCKRFLDLDPTFLGAVHSDKSVVDAVRKQRPFMEIFPGAQCSKDCRAIAKQIQQQASEFSSHSSNTLPLNIKKLVENSQQISTPQ